MKEKKRDFKICEECGIKFLIKTKWQKFCSQKCFHSHERTETHKNNISRGLKKAYAEGRRGNIM